MAIIITPEGKIDFPLNFLVEILDLLDRKLGEIGEECHESFDPDGEGLLEQCESITGLGFAACQTYITSVIGWYEVDRKHALALGPKHAGGRAVADLIDHASNLWKHLGEWPPPGVAHKGRDRISTALRTIGVAVDQDFPLSAVLWELSPHKSAQFKALTQALVAWREAVSASVPPPRGEGPPVPQRRTEHP